MLPIAPMSECLEVQLDDELGVAVVFDEDDEAEEEVGRRDDNVGDIVGKNNKLMKGSSQ